MNATMFGQFTVTFHSLQLHRGNRSLHTGPSEKFIIMSHPKEDHSERKFKLNYRKNPGPTEKVIQNKRSIHISDSQLNIEASIMELF